MPAFSHRRAYFITIYAIANGKFPAHK